MHNCKSLLLVGTIVAAVLLMVSSTYAQPDSDEGGLRKASPEKELTGPQADASDDQLAEGDESESTGEDGESIPPKGLFGGNYLPFVMMGGLVLLFLWMSRNRRKQAAKRKEVLSALKKGDKVTTIGGIVGTIIETRETEITVKVDETNNVRMHFARWAIRGVGDEAKTEDPNANR